MIVYLVAAAAATQILQSSSSLLLCVKVSRKNKPKQTKQQIGAVKLLKA